MSNAEITREKSGLRRESAELPPLETSVRSFDEWRIRSDESFGEDQYWRFENSREPASFGDHLHGFEGPSRRLILGSESTRRVRELFGES